MAFVGNVSRLLPWHIDAEIEKTSRRESISSLERSAHERIDAIVFEGLGSEVRNTTLAALALSLLALLAYMIWFSPGWAFAAGYVALSLIAVLTVPVFYRLSGQTLADELDWLEQREAKEHAEMTSRLETIARELSDLDISEGRRQAEVLTQLLADYHAVVETRFLGKPNGPLEYLATARRVQKHAIQNLTDVIATGHSLSTLSRGSDASEKVGKSEAERRERRGAQVTDQQSRLDALLSENQRLFDALSDTAVEVANIPSFNRYERLDTLAHLTTLAEIASHRS